MRHKARTTKLLPGGNSLKCKSEQSITLRTALPWLPISALQETFQKVNLAQKDLLSRALLCSYSLCLSAPLLPTTVCPLATEAPQ